MNTQRVRTIGTNEQGRDLVVGDVHGCFRTLEHALADLRFDESHDRLFGVGDLVGRGPRSCEAVDWIENRFEAVTLGNHDRAARDWLGARLGGSPKPPYDWIRRLDPREYRRWYGALRRMPLALTIKTPYGPVGVVHAEPPHPDWEHATELLTTGADTDVDNALLGFEEATPVVQRMRRRPVRGLRALVSGHFVVERVEVTTNRWNLDTGAGWADQNRLSLLEVNAAALQPYTFDVREDL